MCSILYREMAQKMYIIIIIIIIIIKTVAGHRERVHHTACTLYYKRFVKSPNLNILGVEQKKSW